ncbi:hypothetical protein FXO38_01037 [Capsicum annuum]|nr:hypothetical protein FXO38_01037 [Capsicum annuum]
MLATGALCRFGSAPYVQRLELALRAVSKTRRTHKSTPCPKSNANSPIVDDTPDRRHEYTIKCSRHCFMGTGGSHELAMHAAMCPHCAKHAIPSLACMVSIVCDSMVRAALVPWCGVPWYAVPWSHGARCHGAWCRGAMMSWRHGGLVPWCHDARRHLKNKRQNQVRLCCGMLEGEVNSQHLVGIFQVRMHKIPLTMDRKMIGLEKEGQTRATKGRILVDHGSKATMPLTIPRHLFKSSVKDSTHRSMEIVLQGSHHDPSTMMLSQRYMPLGAEAPTVGQQVENGCMHHF